MDEKVITEYAAIAIPTLCRYEHLSRCIKSLQANNLASCTDVHISLDCPPSDEYVDGYNKISAMLDEGIEGFHSVNIYRQDVNLGALANSRWIFDKAGENHTRVIFSEDDNEFSPNYLEYMNRCLDYYRDDERVIAVSAYNYPILTDCVETNVYQNDIYFSALGYGTWYSKFRSHELNMTKSWLKELYIDADYIRALRKCSPNQYCNFIKGYLNYGSSIEDDNQVYTIDLTYGMYMFEQKLNMVFPIISKVRNWGYDGTGAHCAIGEENSNLLTHRNYDFSKQAIDKENCFEEIREYNISKEVLYTNLNSFFAISKSELIRTDIAYICSRIIGVKSTRRLLNRCR